MPSAFGVFLSWWGLFLLGAVDATLAFVVPFGIDAALIYVVARAGPLFWIYPLMATAGSLAGAGTTFWIGVRAGDAGLERFVSAKTLERVRAKVEKGGAFAIAIPALLPPPFPLKPFILTCGALQVDRWRFFGTFAIVRGLRFAIEAYLARRYGDGVLQILESDTFQYVIVGLVVVALAATGASIVLIWRKVRQRP